MMSRAAATDRNRSRGAARLLLFALAAASAACTRPTTVDSAWTEGVPRNQSFSKVVVVGVSPAYTTRCRFERMMMDSLNSPGVTAITSCSRMKSDEPLSREAIVAIVESSGADAVLATRLVDGKVGLEEGNSNETRNASYYKPIGYGYDSYYGGYGMPVTYVNFVAEESTFTLKRTVVVSSNLYETKGASLIYSLDTRAYDKASQSDVIDAVTEAIAGRLRKDGLVR